MASQVQLNIVQSATEQNHAILAELEVMINNLLSQGEPSHLNLHQLSLSKATRARLKRILGEGEVEVETTRLGFSRIVETGFPAVWWVSHYGDDGEVMDEFLEVNFTPEVVIASVEDIQAGLNALKASLFNIGMRYRPQIKGHKKKRAPDDHP